MDASWCSSFEAPWMPRRFLRLTIAAVSLECWLLLWAGIISWMRPANERQRYIVMLPLIGWAQTQNGPWVSFPGSQVNHFQTISLSCTDAILGLILWVNWQILIRSNVSMGGCLKQPLAGRRWVWTLRSAWISGWPWIQGHVEATNHYGKLVSMLRCR